MRCLLGTDLKTLQPVPATRGIADLEELQDPDEHFGVVIRQRAGQQAVGIIQLDVETATRENSTSARV